MIWHTPAHCAKKVLLPFAWRRRENIHAERAFVAPFYIDHKDPPILISDFAVAPGPAPADLGFAFERLDQAAVHDSVAFIEKDSVDHNASPDDGGVEKHLIGAQKWSQLSEITGKHPAQRVGAPGLKGASAGAVNPHQLSMRGSELSLLYSEIVRDAAKIMCGRFRTPGKIFAELLMVDPDFTANHCDRGFFCAEVAKVLWQIRGHMLHP